MIQDRIKELKVLLGVPKTGEQLLSLVVIEMVRLVLNILRNI
jgi:hypothetical protein